IFGRISFQRGCLSGFGPRMGFQVCSPASLCTATSPEIPSSAAEAVEALAHYKDRPLDYLEKNGD
ncbi:unnamed protein product, partial [Coregonus sp. 'balchen']